MDNIVMGNIIIGAMLGLIAWLGKRQFDHIDEQLKEVKLDIKDIKAELKDVNNNLHSLDKRLTGLESSFEERGRWEARLELKKNHSKE